MLLYQFNCLTEGRVVKRPSQYIKTPYVSDVRIGEQTDEILAHTASLGCGGLADVHSHVLMERSSAKNKCGYVIYLSVVNKQIIGIHPKLAEQLVENALTLNAFSKLQNIQFYRRETTIRVKNRICSRFDFTGVDSSGIPFIMEVKNVPLADYEDVSNKDRKKMNFSGRDENSKVSYFPDGYRKKASDPVSPRALKHMRELTIIKRETPIRCIMCYVIQRTDVDRFQPSVIDPEYREAFKQAVESGVEIITMVVRWTKTGSAYFVRDDLPIVKIV